MVGIEKIKELSQKMGVEHVGAHTFSNSTEVPDALEGLGYSRRNYYFRTVRKKPLRDVVKADHNIRYFMQARERDGHLVPTQVHNFEHFMNTVYLRDQTRKEEFMKLLADKRVEEASYKVAVFDYEKNLHPHYEKIFNMRGNPDDVFEVVAKAIKALYVEGTTEGCFELIEIL